MLTGEGMISQIEVAEKCLNDGTVMAASGSGKSRCCTLKGERYKYLRIWFPETLNSGLQGENGLKLNNEK